MDRASPSPSSEAADIQFWIGIPNGFRKRPEQERLARLGCCILEQEGFRDMGYGLSIWHKLLPQLSTAIPSVNAAAAAFGALYEAIVLTGGSSSISKRRAALQYGNAIRHVQQDVAHQLYGPVPLLLACALLGFAELLRCRQYNALMHLQGALRLLRSREEVLTKAKVLDAADPNRSNALEATTATPLEDNLSLMFMTLDIQKASYALGQPPELSVSHLQCQPHVSSSIRNVNEAATQLVRLIHSCYHFTAHASQFKYLSRAAIPSDLLLEQGRHIANLSLWLDSLNQDFLLNQPDSSHKLLPEDYCHALVLRTQCLSTLIYLSTVLSAHECSYDLHRPRFQSIVQDAAVVLAQGSGTPSALRQFRPSPGIVQPLFFTATKYRHGDWRRQAIDLLRRSGREGPFDGKLLAAIASRTITIEESTHRPPLTERILPEHITESDRVHGTGIHVEAKDDEESVPCATVMFSRCKNVEAMLCGSVSWEHERNWDMWNEIIEL
ncbi:hypothetical protein EPUS_02836 [Endocarpon pusillum Z07020]|uniref:Transcription factor domain-containing protein n=1 Tax=Endocarpon pusillum (strain Z07020 / HMAS-L-300199) TaxID=1263415 RepID=U1HTG6_ENDPU|nr:uncharacterized protein EPUS_02836 [Endocarpon pusillum Z07020]ERF72554.1 hypothetical protein EPUS_02836 [Endocarpon pusillum Z07020]